MDGTRLQALVYRGYGIAAKRVGLPFDVYRPSGASNPLASGNKIATARPAAFTPHNGSDFQFGRPSDYRDEQYHGLFDGSDVHRFDYFVGGQGTFFIASLDPIQPPLCIGCNRTLTFTRPGVSATGVGLSTYSGSTPATETPLMSGWPACVLEGGKSKMGGILPGDVGSPKFETYVPAVAGVILACGDIATDEHENRYIVESVELRDLGWRLKLMQALI